MTDYNKPQLYTDMEDAAEIIIDNKNKSIWFSVAALSKLAGTSQPDVTKKLNRIREQRGEDYFITNSYKIATGKPGRPPTFYRHTIARIALFRTDTPEAHTFQDYVNHVMDLHEFGGAPALPSTHLKRQFKRHAHTQGYQKERLDNVHQRKHLTGQVKRTVHGQPNYGKIMAMFHFELTGKTKKQLLANYAHATKQTAAIDALGSIVVNQMNLLMQSVSMILEKYPEDHIPDAQHIARIETLVRKFSGNLREHLQLLADELGVPLEQLGENSNKKRLL